MDSCNRASLQSSSSDHNEQPNSQAAFFHSDDQFSHLFDPRRTFFDPPSANHTNVAASPRPSNVTPTTPSLLLHRPRGGREKKRARASRRAPTTILTTDTSNFRAMVQEFTGIPTPSLAPSPYFLAPFSERVRPLGSSLGLSPSSSPLPSSSFLHHSACSNSSTSAASTSRNLGFGSLNSPRDPVLAFPSLQSSYAEDSLVEPMNGDRRADQSLQEQPPSETDSWILLSD